MRVWRWWSFVWAWSGTLGQHLTRAVHFEDAGAFAPASVSSTVPPPEQFARCSPRFASPLNSKSTLPARSHLDDPPRRGKSCLSRGPVGWCRPPAPTRRGDEWGVGPNDLPGLVGDERLAAGGEERRA